LWNITRVSDKVQCMKVIITGSTGFIGSHLASFFEQRGHELILLSRHPTRPNMRPWNPEEGQLDPLILEGSDVLIHLSGENIFGRWNKAKMEKIRDSRVNSTRFLCSQLLALKMPPPLFIGASAVGYYGDRKDEVLTEESAPGNDFLAEVCRDWERAAEPLAAKKVRVVFSRFGIVLGSDGGVLKNLEKAFRMGMGGYLGSGKQMMSWIAIDDLCSAMEYIMERKDIAGPVNFVAPQSVSNKEFTDALGKLLNRPALMPVPKFALTMLFGEGAEMFLASTHAFPSRLVETGYQFRYPILEQALKKYLLEKA
jgi:uncharacterized protein (TIGR01777 family)